MKNPLKRKSVQLWLEALRSGKYKQGKLYLKKDNKYCCLGVACDLYNKTHKVKVDFVNYTSDNQQINTGLPPVVMKWLGLNHSEGRLSNNYYLSTKNDNGVSFNKIADLIESNPEGLFVE